MIMNLWVAIAGGILLVVVVALAVTLWISGRSKASLLESQLSALRQEMQTLLTSQAQGFTGQISQLNQTVLQQLGQMNQTVQKGVENSVQLTSKSQDTWTVEVRNSREVLAKIQQQLGEVQQAGRELSTATQTLQTVLGGAKTRGSLGEIALERLLSDSIPAANYETQYRFSTGEIVDAVIRFQEKILPIDSKFPLDDYRKLAAGGDEARKGFGQAVRGHADAVSRKYILPGEGTLDIALMFIASEGVYYELLMTEDAKGVALDEYCRSKGVIPVSPNTLYAHLRVILMGLHGMQIEENAKKLRESLAGLKKQFDGFGEVYERLGTHLRNAQQSYFDANQKLDRARVTLEQTAEGALPEAASKPLEIAAKQ